MGARRPLLTGLAREAAGDRNLAGGKAARLADLAGAGFAVPPGFVLTTAAYRAFLEENRLATALRVELERKPMADMRWEEIWDAALRIRSLFLGRPLPARIADALAAGLEGLAPGAPLAVRSSAPAEDDGRRSFAGLHESVVDVRGRAALEDAVRRVWASLWSDAALLYRRELGLDPGRSGMAVLVQEMVAADRSGVAFGRDPRGGGREALLVEAVPGPCRLLVDGAVEPDRWEIDRADRRLRRWRPGDREGKGGDEPLLDEADLEEIVEALLAVEAHCGWAPDLEWTGRAGSLTLLQARPITTAAPAEGDKRSWYLTLRPGDGRLRELRDRVAGRLIPALQARAAELAREEPAALDDRRLADAIGERSRTLAEWRRIYWDEFIPFAHGVRRLATYYNDHVKPADPYEFVGLLRDQPLLAVERNRAMAELAGMLAADDALRRKVAELLDRGAAPPNPADLEAALGGSGDFLRRLRELGERHLDIRYDRARLRDDLDTLLRNLLELAALSARPGAGEAAGLAADLEQRLLAAAGPEREEEALEVIATGRVSWKLRDDDNLLVARLEAQLFRALEIGADRLRAAGRLRGGGSPTERHAERLAAALRDPGGPPLAIEPPREEGKEEGAPGPPGETPRQLTGQPASPGTATGPVRVVRGRADLGAFRRGEVLVCDAIQPTMTHLVPLAGAIVERRGGMLIHGAIIARELGIPCVNGVRHAAGILRTGDPVTVDGHLGIVTIGAAEFDLEFGRPS